MAEEDELEVRIDEALAEYMQKHDSGETLDRDAFVSQHPELKDRLSELLDAADWIEQLAGPTVADLAGRKLASEVDAALERAVSSATSSTMANDPLRPSGMGGTQQAAFLDEPTINPLDADTLPHRSHAAGLYDQTLPSGSPFFPKLGSSLSQPVLPCEFGEYRLERILGRGGMGVVYYGHQKSLERPVAVKMIRSGALASTEEVQRFYAEARSAARLDHPNIVTVYQCGEQDGHHYFSMDYVEGTDLARMAAEKPLEPKLAARYVRDVALAIQFAHNRGILHRDLKPANVLVDVNDNVRVTDFGLAKHIDHESGITATGAALGTPSYMSPEQAAGRSSEQTAATDIYSLGAILFTILTGTPPFKCDNVVQTIMQVIHRPAPSVRSLRPDVDPDLATIVDTCLQKSPDRRYASASALAEDLQRFMTGSPILARPMSPIRKAWYWLLGVPIFGAVLDNRVVEPTEAHRWVQRGLISTGVLMLIAWFMLLIPESVWYKNRMPTRLRIAAGVEGGNYNLVARAIGAEVHAYTEDTEAETLATEGTKENIDKLLSGEAELGLVQADAVNAPSIAVVAPLFYEAVHIIVAQNIHITSITDFRGKRVVLGTERSGSRNAARLLLQHSGVDLGDVEIVDGDWRELGAGTDADSAIVVARVGDPAMADLLSSGSFQLFSMSNAWEFALDEPAFHPLKISAAIYPGCPITEAGIATVATTAFLATRIETPRIVVESALRSLYESDLTTTLGIFPAERAAHWQGLPWHPASREFFKKFQSEVLSER